MKSYFVPFKELNSYYPVREFNFTLYKGRELNYFEPGQIVENLLCTQSKVEFLLCIHSESWKFTLFVIKKLNFYRYQSNCWMLSSKPIMNYFLSMFHFSLQLTLVFVLSYLLNKAKGPQWLEHHIGWLQRLSQGENQRLFIQQFVDCVMFLSICSLQ